MPNAKYTAKLIKHDSQEFRQACELRYKLFFAQHNLPKSIVRDLKQKYYFHAAIAINNKVIAYGQLVPHPNKVYQICQMVVAPEYQKLGLGKKILLFLIDIAKQEQAIALTLNARLTAIGFYQKLGFQTDGVSFLSTVTGVPHVKMNREFNEVISV